MGGGVSSAQPKRVLHPFLPAFLHAASFALPGQVGSWEPIGCRVGSWGVSGVGAAVLLHGVSIAEAATADGAAVRPLAGVYA